MPTEYDFDMENTDRGLKERVSQRARESKIKLTNDLLLVSIARQKLWHWVGDTLRTTYPVSTSLRPPSCREGSFGTPTGFFQISDKIGAEASAGMVFKGRVPQGYHWAEASPAEQAEALITSRILWLDGLEPGHNRHGSVDTRQRYIYIHGTNRPERIGTPQSAGCVLLRDEEMIHLFQQVKTGTVVWIGEAETAD